MNSWRGLKRQPSSRIDPEAHDVWITLGDEYWGVVDKRAFKDIKEAAPARHAGDVAHQCIAGLNTRRNTALTEQKPRDRSR
jgi:hypothetical protein